ncbi:MAG: TlyA family RNA methyltransferase [Cyanobacteria bacterium J06641_5]
MSKQRLDLLLVEREFYTTRQQAQRAIRAGLVFVNGNRVDKPGTEVKREARLDARQPNRFVSRGGEKLLKALETFEIDVCDRDCLDGGISTGGFTDCLLQAGARRVYGIDVGYGQVAWKLRQDPRVVLRERTNIRHLKPEELYGTDSATIPTLGCADVSFISLVKVLGSLWQLLGPPREVVLLVKPQFEVGRDRVGKKGVVRDPGDRAWAIAAVLQAAQGCGWSYRGLTWSPLTGPAGNVEYLLWLSQPPENWVEEGPSFEKILQIATAAGEALAKSK